MNVINTTWRQLVRRRLWPVALLLVAALAAVPVLLVQEPEVPAPSADLVPLASEPDDTIAEPVVAAVTPEDRARRRRVLGVRKDPFAPAPVKKAKVDEPKPEAPPKSDTGIGTEVPPVSGGGGGVTVPVPTEPVAPKKYYSAGTIIVRFGDATSDQLDRFAIEKLEPVPDDELPLLIYMGLTKDGKKAKFLVDASVEVDGDGTCKPHRSSCEVIELSVGETEFLDVRDTEGTEVEAAEDETAEDEAAESEAPIVAQYQLDLVDIKRAGDDDVK